MKKIKKDSSLLEWYEGENMQGNFCQQEMPPPYQQDYNVQTQIEQPKVEQPKPEEISKKVDDLGEMYKAIAIAKAIESKLAAYSFKESDEDKSKIKTSIKELSKKLEEIINKL